ncbi:Flavin-dependent oxidoreductase, luciferase family (includes alkanesulfonate monooxygenase SsuD and methylene tetrahydromethanopterin reductase) [Polaromonas sp. YR568]|uniref:LLM class flavin-dependent oxidoreductase n=1 Tax=Polaromonas sp. YR568 TaxID=1855301 RepID=UPI0008E862B1|nr:LLM class flavin-dependent oxidoreductase [Polaromonas sp. YR568]SFU66778.1 Flavin-dependent oxidoreductase, luciferase family (includes alkanesulfonate monooxygenase SsuD and methylene tetrahydromethanopterin reductase) [Polaromonas sp. YR568]
MTASLPPQRLPAMRIDLAGWTRDATHGDTRAFFALFEEADRLGFDGVWFSEFRLTADARPYPSPLLLASALLARTERLRVGTAVLVLPLHQPQLLAEELQQLAWQSGKRFDAGLGRGTDPATLQALGIPADATRACFEAGLEVLLVGEHPPLYIAGSTPETIGLAVRHALPLLLSLEPPEIKQLAELDAQAGAVSGQLRTSLRARSSLARYVCIGATQAEVEGQLQDLWPRLHARRIYFAGRRGVPAHEVPPPDTGRMLSEQFIAGTPDACHAQIMALRESTGIGHLRCVFNGNGLLDNAQALKQMRMFANSVLPALRAV